LYDIVHVCSFLHLQHTGAYSTSKTALIGLTKVLAEQFATMNIRVNCIAPGLIKTKFSELVGTCDCDNCQRLSEGI
jgi:dehydrogenase/reductase SDR family protein 4